MTTGNVLGLAWTKLVERSDAFAARRERSRNDLLQISWMSSDVKRAISDLRYVELCECGSSHVVRIDPTTAAQEDVALRCLACNASVPTESFIVRLLEWTHGGEDWESAKAGGPYAVYECPSCEAKTYHREEDRCASCGYVAEDETCEHCGEPLGIVHVANGDPYHDECAYQVHLLAKD